MRVFLSYHTPDETLARGLKQALESRCPDLDIFFAAYNLRLGAFWLPALGDAIRRADAFLLLLGDKGLGPWQKLEYYEALDRHTQEPSFSLVPLIVGASAPGLPFLRNLHWVQADDPLGKDTLGRIIGAVRGDDQAASSQPWRSINPYRGLLALKEEDADFFFGREQETRDVLSAISAAKNRLICLVGNSGVGKSSLIQAGVIAALKRQRYPGGSDYPPALKDSRRWAYLSMKPGDNPLRAVAAAFVSQWFDRATDPALYEETDRWAERLAGKGRLADLIDATQAHFRDIGVEPPRRVLLYIDQAEELYARAAPGAQLRFSRLIAEGLAEDRLLVASSLRSDYYGHLQSDDLLFPATTRVDVAPLTEESLLTVLKEPARSLDARFDNEELIATLLRGARGEPGALPLLADFMTELWREMQKRGDGVLQLASHTEFIHVGAALARRADEFLAHHPAEREKVKRLFSLKLAMVQHEGEPVRRRATRAECSDDEWTLIEQLASHDWRLLVTGQEYGAPIAEVAHEVLLREWPTLKTWLADQHDFLVWLGQIERARKSWEETGKEHKSDALLMGRALAEAEHWLEDRGGDVPAEDARFIRKSTARRNAQRRTQQAAAVVAALLLAGIAIFAGLQWRLAAQQRDAAEVAKVRAQRAEELSSIERDDAQRGQSNYLAELARRSLEQGNIVRSVLLALEALPDARSNIRRPVVRAAEEMLTLNYHQFWAQQSVFGDASSATSMQFLPSGDGILTTSEDGTARIWSVDAGKPARILVGHLAPVSAAAISPDGTRIATTSFDGSTRVWAADSGELVGLLAGQTTRIDMAEFHPDGKHLLTGSFDGVVRLWDLSTSRLMREFQTGKLGETWGHFSPDGKRILTIAAYGAAILWDATSGARLQAFDFKSSSVGYGEFTPDGTRIILRGTSSENGIFAADNLDRIATIPGSFRSMAVSPDGSLVAFNGQCCDKPLSIFDARTGSPVATIALPKNKGINAFAFTADSGRIVLGGDEFTGIFNTHTGALITSITTDSTYGMAISRDGSRIATRGNSIRIWKGTDAALIGAVQAFGRSYNETLVLGPGGRAAVRATSNGPTAVWDLQQREQKAVLLNSGSATAGLKFSPDGRWIVAGSRLGRMSVWSANTFERADDFNIVPNSNVLFSADNRRMAAATGKSVVTVLDDRAQPRSIDQGKARFAATMSRISADGRLLFTAGGSAGSLFDLDTGRLIATITEPNGQITEALFNFDGSRLITKSDDNRMRLFDTSTGAELAMLADDIVDGSFRAYHSLITRSSSGELRIWNLTSGKILMRQETPQKETYRLLASSDGNILASSDNAGVTIWDAASGREVVRIAVADNSPYDTQVAPKGNRIVTKQKGNVVATWDAHTGEQVSALKMGAAAESNLRLGIDHQASRVLVRHEDGALDLYNADSGERITRINEQFSGLTIFSNDDERLLLPHDDGRIDLWDPRSGKRIAWLIDQAASKVRHGVSISSDSSRIVTTTNGNAASLWDARTGKKLADLGGHHAEVFTAAFLPDSELAETISKDGTAILWDARSVTPLRQFVVPAQRMLEYARKGRRIVVVDRQTNSLIYDTATWQIASTIEHPDAGLPAALSRDGRLLITVPRGGAVAQIFDTKSGRNVGVLEGHEEQINGIWFSEDDKQILTVSNDGTARIWDSSEGRLRYILKHGDGVAIVHGAFNKKGTHVATLDRDGDLRVWRTDDGSQVSGIGKGATYRMFMFSPDSEQLVAFGRSDEEEIVKFDVATGQTLASIKLLTSSNNGISYVYSPLSEMVASEDGSTIGSAQSGVIWRMPWTVQGYVDWAKELVPRCLTPQERESVYLDPHPPSWCISMGKWPYNTAEWKKRLADKASTQQSLQGR